MIISVEKAKELVSFNGWTDEKIKMKLLAVEQTIRAYTNNNFQDSGFRVRADIADSMIMSDSLIPFSQGDTVQITESRLNKGLFTVATADAQSFTVSDATRDEESVLITKVVYPADVVACAVNLLEWEVNNRDRVGIQSETLSRHSVTYFNMDGNNQVMGYPSSRLGCLKAYRKMRC